MTAVEATVRQPRQLTDAELLAAWQTQPVTASTLARVAHLRRRIEAQAERAA
jgi:hypothetical protein